MVFPFVEGTHPDESRALAGDAAELLAQMHRGIATSWTGGEGPASRRLPWSEHNELDRYHDAGGTVDTTTPFDAIPWIRQRLRLEASQWFHDTTSMPVHSDYHEAQVRAFATLRGRRVNG